MPSPRSVLGPAACAAIATLALTAAAPQASAQDSNATTEARYAEWVDRALEEFEAGRFREALAAFRQAHETSPNARSLRGLAMASFELREYPDALRYARASLASEVRPLSEELREHVGGLEERCRAFVGVFELEGVPDGGEVRVDETPIDRSESHLILGLGPHQLRASADGFTPDEQRVLVHGGEQRTIRFELTERTTEETPTAVIPDAASTAANARVIPRDSVPPPPPPARDAVPGFALIATGVALLAGAVGSLVWLVDRQDTTSACQLDPRACANIASIATERDASIGVTAALGAAGLGFVIGGTVSLTTP